MRASQSTSSRLKDKDGNVPDLSYHVLFIDQNIQYSKEVSNKLTNSIVSFTHRTTTSLDEARLILHMEQVDCLAVNFDLCVNDYDHLFLETLSKRFRETGALVFVLDPANLSEAKRHCLHYGYEPVVMTSDNCVTLIHHTAVHTRNTLLHRESLRFKNLQSMQRDYINGVAHDVRSPLGVINSSTTLIEKLNDGANEGINKYCDRIQNAVTRIDDMMDWSLRIAEQHFDDVDVKYEALNVHPIVRACIEDLYVQHPERSISLEISLPLIPDIYGNSDHIQRCIENVLHNAIKYSSNDSTVTVRLVMDEGAVNIYIEDQGVGIPSQELEHIGKRMYRATNSGEADGTGLGLFTVNTLIVAMQGRMTVSSMEGQGTTVVLTFARSDALERVLEEAV